MLLQPCLLFLYPSLIIIKTEISFLKTCLPNLKNRYDELNNILIAIASYKKLKGEEKQKAIHLCAEEYMWVRNGRIPAHIWNSWKNGIKVYLRNEAIKEVFDEEKALWKSFYYGFFDELGN